MPKTLVVQAEEASTSQYKTNLVDQNEVPIAPVDITGLTFTLYDVATDAIINTRQDVDINNANGGTVATVGSDTVFTFVFDAADHAIINDALDFELHRALFHLVWAGGELWWEIDVWVRNINRVP